MKQKLRRACLCAGLATAIATLAAPVVAATPAAPRPASAPPCSVAEYRQLDFWIGDWDTFESSEPDGDVIARARVESVAEGCAVRERYEQGDGLIGESLLSYDAVRKQWQQTWITNRGANMVLWGNLKDGVLVLEGEAHLQDGTTVLQRIRWQPQGAGVREWAESSRDGGKTWSPAFDVLFLKRRQ